jgi:hypothetical protein
MRPINEVIAPQLVDQRRAFETQFSGMANAPFSYVDYEKTRIQLIIEIQSKLTYDEKLFLISFKEGNPAWDKFPVNNLKYLPAVQWKLMNINKLKKENPEKHKEMVKVLREKLLS